MSDKKKKHADRSKQFEENRTKLDDMEEQKFTDDIPMEDLKIDMEQEKEGPGYQDTSQTERKYRYKDNKKPSKDD